MPARWLLNSRTRAAGSDLVEGVKDDARHRALVALAEAVDVEELEAAPARRPAAGALLGERPEVELLLRLAVRVERAERRQHGLVVVVAVGAVAVGRRAARVDERDACAVQYAQSVCEYSTLTRVRYATSSSRVSVHAPRWTTPASAGRSRVEPRAELVAVDVVPKSMPRCSGRSAKSGRGRPRRRRCRAPRRTRRSGRR